MSKLEFVIIKEKQIKGDKKLKIFKILGLDITQSDFAKFTTYSNSYWIDSNNEIKILSNNIVTEPNNQCQGVRPVVKYSEIKNNVSKTKELLQAMQKE